MSSPRVFGGLCAAALLFAAGGADGQACRGDCNGDGRVVVGELITGVNIALGAAAIRACRSIDADGDGRVSVNELIAAVNALLEGCGGSACPLSFDSDFDPGGAPRFCAFHGAFNAACPDNRLDATFFSTYEDGQHLVIAVVFSTPPVLFGGFVDAPTRGTLDIVALAEDPSVSDPIGGRIQLADNGRTLVIEPNPVPFAIDDCDFRRYAGTFTGIRDRPD
jgi:hypothetical protein